MKKIFLINLLLLFNISFTITDSVNKVEKVPFRHGKDRALFFVVNNYDEWSDLNTPIKDAKEISKELRELYGFQTEIVENPNRTDIYKKLDEYRQFTYEKDAQLLIFFSGHGQFIESQGEGFYIPRDGKKMIFTRVVTSLLHDC